jgi:hypothetical protein
VEAKERTEESVRRIVQHFDETSNALFANIGQIDDKLNRRTSGGA